MSRYRRVKNASGQMGWARLVPFAFGVNLTATALAAGGNVSGSFQTDPGLPFVLCEMRCNSDGDTSTTTFQNLLFSIVDGESQQLFSNIPVSRGAMFGTVDFPRQLPSEVEIRPSDTITSTMTNQTGGALTTVIRLAFIGYKLVNWTPGKPEE